jgi:hypothetical protein
VTEWVGLAGVVLGVLLGFGGQLLLDRRQAARRLDDARRQLYVQFLTALKLSLEHLAQGATERLNAAVERGAYAGTYLQDHAELQNAISGMQLVSTGEILSRAEALREAQWDVALREGNAEPVPDTVPEADRRAVAEAVAADLKRLSGMKDAFVIAAKRELRLSAPSH